MGSALRRTRFRRKGSARRCPARDSIADRTQLFQVGHILQIWVMFRQVSLIFLFMKTVFSAALTELTVDFRSNEFQGTNHSYLL